MIRGGDRRRHRLEHDREAARLLERERVVVELERGRRRCGPARGSRRASSPTAASARRGPTTPMFDSAIARTRDDHPAGALELDEVGAALLHHPDRARRPPARRRPRSEPNGRSPTTSGRRAARVTARVRKIISSRVTGTVDSWPSMTIAAVSPTRTSSTPASSASARRGRVVGGDHRDLVAAALHLARARGSASLPGAGRRGPGRRGRVLIRVPPRAGRCRSGGSPPTAAATASVGPSRSATAT